MEIRVNKVIPSSLDEFVVSFDSDYGSAEGLWKQNSPTIGCSYDVEIEVDGDITWLVNTHQSHEVIPKLEKSGNLTRIVAQLESSEEDGCCVLRIGTSILLTEIKGMPNLDKGTFIEMKVHSIRLFDTKM